MYTRQELSENDSVALVAQYYVLFTDKGKGVIKDSNCVYSVVKFSTYNRVIEDLHKLKLSLSEKVLINSNLYHKNVECLYDDTNELEYLLRRTVRRLKINNDNYLSFKNLPCYKQVVMKHTQKSGFKSKDEDVYHVVFYNILNDTDYISKNDTLYRDIPIQIYPPDKFILITTGEYLLDQIYCYMPLDSNLTLPDIKVRLKLDYGDINLKSECLNFLSEIRKDTLIPMISRGPSKYLAYTLYNMDMRLDSVKEDLRRLETLSRTRHHIVSDIFTAKNIGLDGIINRNDKESYMYLDYYCATATLNNIDDLKRFVNTKTITFKGD